ncbi:MAG: cysteate synthase [bacterium]|nr:cysteate synthase [bacterium]
MGKYILECLECGNRYESYRTHCEKGCNALLRGRYETSVFKPSNETSMFKFIDRLPCQQAVDTTIGPVVYKSDGFARKLGLKNLYIGFNGYWPEKGARNMTGTWKDYEALPTLACFRENGLHSIILASAGNTARAFAYAATVLDMDTYIVIGDRVLDRMWLPTGKNTHRVHIIAVKDCGDYYRAIELKNNISSAFHIPPEAGVRNIARRAGMGTVMLEAARVMGTLPHHYFQAVGSGTGGISVHEAALELLQTDTFKNNGIPRLHLAQNDPFTPIYDAWEMKKTIEPYVDIDGQIARINELHADVLANRNPPYSPRGGVHDVLVESNGNMYKVTNREAIDAGRLFEETEGIDIVPAASVCAATVINVVKSGRVGPDEVILMNITGGGMKKLKNDYHWTQLEPDIVIKNESDPALGRLVKN